MGAYTAPDGTYYFEGFNLSPATTLAQPWYYPQDHTLSSPDWFLYLTLEVGSTTIFDVGFYPVPDDERVTLDIIAYGDNNSNGQMDADEVGIESLTFIVYTHIRWRRAKVRV